MKQSRATTSPDALELLLSEYRVSWAGLSSPLRMFTKQKTFAYRHTPLTEIWRDDLSQQEPCFFQNSPT